MPARATQRENVIRTINAGPLQYNTRMEASRAAARAARMTVRRFASCADADWHDREYWAAIPPGERMVQAWRLSEELWRWRGEFPDEPGLCRSVAVVRRP